MYNYIYIKMYNYILTFNVYILIYIYIRYKTIYILKCNCIKMYILIFNFYIYKIY